MFFGIHICPIEIMGFFSGLWGVRYLWHCCQDKIKAWKCGHKEGKC